MNDYAKCYINYEGNTYMVTFCDYKIRVYLVTKYNIFKKIPLLKNINRYIQLDVDDGVFPFFVMAYDPMFNHLDTKSET